MRWADPVEESTSTATKAAPPAQPPPQPTKEELLTYAQEVMHLFKVGVPFDLAYNMPAPVRAAFVTVIKVGI